MIVEDADVLLGFYKYPAEHWLHLRATSPIENNFATAGLRTKVAKGPGWRATGLGMACKLIEAVTDPLARREPTPPPGWNSSATAPSSTKDNFLERPTDITPAQPDESHETEIA